MARRPEVVWPEARPRDLVSRCPRSGCGDEERRERIDMHDRAPQEPKPEMGCLGARDLVGFSAGPLALTRSASGLHRSLTCSVEDESQQRTHPLKAKER